MPKRFGTLCFEINTCLVFFFTFNWTNQILNLRNLNLTAKWIQDRSVFSHSNTTVCLIIHLLCKSCEPEIVLKKSKQKTTQESKVWTFWEGHKIWKNLPLSIWRYSVASNFKWKIFFKFCALFRRSKLYSKVCLGFSI